MKWLLWLVAGLGISAVGGGLCPVTSCMERSAAV